MTVEKHEYDSKYEIVVDGETIITREGERQWPPDDEAVEELFDVANEILEDANMGNPQREALLDVLSIIRVSIGQVEVVDHRDVDP